MWSCNPTSGYTVKGIEIRISKTYLCSHVHCSMIHNSQDTETTSIFISGWMDKENVVWICNKVLFGLKKKKEIFPFVTTQMNLEDITLSETSQTQKDKYYMIPLIWGIWNSQTPRSRKWNDSCQELRKGGSREVLVERHQVSVVQDE